MSLYTFLAGFDPYQDDDESLTWSTATPLVECASCGKPFRGAGWLCPTCSSEQEDTLVLSPLTDPEHQWEDFRRAMAKLDKAAGDGD